MNCSVEKEIPVEHVGLFSYLTYAWLDGFMWRAWRKGIDPASVWTCPSVDGGDHNALVYDANQSMMKF